MARIPLNKGYVVSSEILETEMLKIIDWYTDELFSNCSNNSIIAPFYRIFCDTERFPHNNQEVMAQFGMDVLYETLDNGKQMRMVTPDFKAAVLKKIL